MITPDEIRVVVEQPSELPATATADDYLMEKFERVAIEAVAAYMEGDYACPAVSPEFCLSHDDDCRACWREALREGK